MKHYRKTLTLDIPARMDFRNITPDVEAAVAESGIREGLCLVNSMHITSSVFINDDEPGLHEDYQRWLEKLAPFSPSPEVYHHNRTGEDNGSAHLKNLVLHHQVILPITDGKLDLGPWQEVFYAEFDGQRRKRVVVEVKHLGIELPPALGALRTRACAFSKFAEGMARLGQASAERNGG